MSKLYATVTSEKASKGQGGQKYLNIDINVASNTPTFRSRVIFDELLGIYYISFESLHFKKWSVVYQTEVLTNVEQTKGEKQKGKMCEWCNGQDCFHCDYKRTQ